MATILEQLLAEWETVTAEDKSASDELSDEENSFNDGWSSGMSRAIAILRENGVR